MDSLYQDQGVGRPAGGMNRGEVAPSRGAKQNAEEGKCWGDGRMVFRRPEVRNSELQRSYIVHTAMESLRIAETLAASVMRRRALSPEVLEEQLKELAAMEPEQSMHSKE